MDLTDAITKILEIESINRTRGNLSFNEKERHKELVAIVEKNLPLNLNDLINLVNNVREHYREIYKEKEVELKVELQDAKDQLKVIYGLAKPYAD